VLLLGGRTQGAIDWAVETPNVLNVAVPGRGVVST